MRGYTMKKELNVKQVQKKLKISDFKELDKEKIVEFSSLLPKMDSDVIKIALQQVPEFTKLAQNMVLEYKNIALETLKEGRKGSNAFYKSCNKILDSLQKELDKKFISQKRRDKIINDMVRVAEMIDKKDSEDKRFVLNVFGLLGGFLLLIASGFIYILTFGKIKISK